MKNIKSIIITLALTITLLGSLLITTPLIQTKAATAIKPETIQLQLVNLKCCNIAHNKMVDFKTKSLTEVLPPQEEVNLNIYDYFATSLEDSGMNFNDIRDYLVESRFGKNVTWYNYNR